MSKQQQWMRNRAGGPLHKADISCASNGCWPVAVIDVEDREQVERLIGNYLLANKEGMVPIDAIFFALREFADPRPPKPEEPTGLGAVVEDEDGNLWVCIRQGGTTNWRQCQGENRGRYWPYGQIPVVRVLSDGVRAGESA